MNPPLVSIQSDILSQSHFWEDKGVQLRWLSLFVPLCLNLLHSLGAIRNRPQKEKS